jgi:hypothetical protein
MIASLGISFARLTIAAIAWLGSSAGMMPFGAAEELERLERLGVGGRSVLDPAGLLEPRMLGADTRVVEPGTDRVRLGDLAVLVLQQVGLVAVEDAGEAAGEARRVLLVEPVARRLDAEHLHLGIVEERVEQPDRVRAAADRRDQQVGQAAGAAEHLRARLGADHALEVAHRARDRGAGRRRCR